MSKAKIYYIRPNATSQLPRNVVFLDCETKGDKIGDIEFHQMVMAWTWRVAIDKEGNIEREDWKFWIQPDELGFYLEGEARSKAPLYVVGSNITFDLFASGLVEYLRVSGWKAEMLYDKGLVTIIILEKEKRRLKFLAVQNFLGGGVEQWGEMLGLPKGEVDFASAQWDALAIYCHRDVEITGAVFLAYLGFLRGHDLGGFSPTLSGQAFRAFRHTFMKEKILHYDQTQVNRFVRAGYFGGRVECSFLGALPKGSYTKLDINSMYPAVMREEWYPTKLRQWVRDVPVSYLGTQLEDHCLMAEVELSTPESIYPIRRNGKLCFPVGKFRTILSTPSLNHALRRGHVIKIRQLLVFSRAKLFTSYVDYFYPLKQQYQQEGNEVWLKVVKLLLNALYGKFGEKREKELVRCDDPEGDFYRRPVSVPVTAMEEGKAAFDWRYHPENYPEGEHVTGTEWSAFGTYCLTAGEEEGPMSQPAIAAHVTDYARMKLWGYMERVGVENVLYCDTDSLIIEEKHVPRLDGCLDDAALGCLKVEGTADSLEILGNKDYRFGTERRKKGIRKSAIRNDDGSYTQPHFPGLYSLLRTGITTGFPIGKITKQDRGTYDKGVVHADGRVTPLVLEEGS